ncbi:hypothetical protein RB598_002013 [Gaeumannomyces tritici]
MPLACTPKHADYIEWSCSATILGDLSAPNLTHAKFRIWPNVQCMKLELAKGEVTKMAVKDILHDPSGTFEIKAKKYVICAGAVLTVGILHQSGFCTELKTDRHHLPAMGHFMTEQTLSFCQVILKHGFVEEFNRLRKTGESSRFTAEEAKRVQGPSTATPSATARSRTASTQRVAVDLRSFGYTTPKKENRVTFKPDTNDGFGMPQPTFEFEMTKGDRDRCDAMFIDMVAIARLLGGFLPGAEPKYLPMGSALHVCGTYRAGTGVDKSVVDKTGKVHGMGNLVLGGCGVIPTGNACNPTLTAAAFALAAADELDSVLPRPK